MSPQVEGIRNIIRAQRQQGVYPVELHMSGATLAHFRIDAGDLVSATKVSDTRSMLARIRMPAEAPKSILMFDDVRIVENNAMPDGPLILRPRELMNDPNWLRFIRFGNHQAMPAEGTPWMEKADPGEAPQSSDEVSLAAISNAAGVNPTSVMFKGMEGLDNVENVVVVRFFKNGDIDMCSTFNRYEIIGGLQDALGYVMRGNGN